MSGHRRFDDIRRRRQEDPERRARVEQYKEAMDIAMALTDLRESRGVTQQALAAQLDVTQANISRIERQDDLYLSTLARYIAALGGALHVTAEFPDRTVHLVGDGSTGKTEPVYIRQEIP